MKIILSRKESKEGKKLKEEFQKEMAQIGLEDLVQDTDASENYRGIIITKDRESLTIDIDSEMIIDYLKIYRKVVPALVQLITMCAKEEHAFNKKWCRRD